MKDYECILLDWDGNLAKTLDVWLHALRVPLERRGLILSDVEIASCFGAPREYYMNVGIADLDQFFTEMDAVAAEHLPEVDLYPDTPFLLENLKNSGKQTALITTSLRPNVIRLLDKYDIHRFFDVVITHEDTKRHKPYAEPLEKALELLGGNKERAVMMGDSDKDIVAAKNAGVDSILFYPEAHEKFYNLSELKKHDPTYVVANFREVLEICGKCNATKKKSLA